MKPRKAFAIAANLGDTVLYWTGYRLRPWTESPKHAKAWCTESVAATWLKRVPPARALTDVRVVDVSEPEAPPKAQEGEKL